MAGHSQFKNIMHRKGRQDAAKAKLFAKLAREITVSAKSGTPDPTMNSRLRLAVQAARAENMPKDNIERAIKKAAGNDTETYENIRYEGYGPGGVAIIVEALTDNRNRTGGAVRAAFTKHGGNLGSTGSVSHMFNRVGEIVLQVRRGSADAVLDAAIEAGADDVDLRRGRPRRHPAASRASVLSLRLWRRSSARPRASKPIWKPNLTTQVDEDHAQSHHEADRDAGGRRRRPGRVLQFRGRRGCDGQADRGLTLLLLQPHPHVLELPDPFGSRTSESSYPALRACPG